MNYITGFYRFFILFVFITVGLAVHANAQAYYVDIICVYEGEKFVYSQKAILNKQSTYAGVITGDNDDNRKIIFNALLVKRGKNKFLLQYQFELAGLKSEDSPRVKMKNANTFFKQSRVKRMNNLSQKPPFQLQADIMMPLNKKLLAGYGNGCKFYIKLRQKGNNEKPKGTVGDYQIISEFLYEGNSFPVKVVVNPGTQSNYIAYMNINGTLHKFSLNILPGELSLDDGLNFSYSFFLRVNSKRIVSAKGKVELFPGAKAKVIAKGKNWKYKVRVLAF